MTGTAARTASNWPVDAEPGSQKGWYIGAALALAVIAVGLGLWFSHHP
ncbi:MAG TPA: hypothetical protein VGV89_01665 [Thermoplasmata archaeon]|nr:hypothetical protein [Thermoplasmata archaeon]